MGGRHQQEERGPGVVVLYTSLMILLLAFFILLNAMGKVEEAKVEAAIQSLQSGFGLLSGGDSPLIGAGRRLSSEVVMPIVPVEQDYRYIRGLSRTLDLDREVSLLRSETSRTVVMSGGLLFEGDSTVLSDKGKEFLRLAAEVMRNSRYPISLYGHTDGPALLSPGGQDAWRISAERALAVLRYLVAQGVAPSRLAAFGMAGFSPRVSPRDPNHARLNNRVEMVFDARDSAAEDLPPTETDPKVGLRGFTFELLPQDKGGK